MVFDGENLGGMSTNLVELALNEGIWPSLMRKKEGWGFIILIMWDHLKVLKGIVFIMLYIT